MLIIDTHIIPIQIYITIYKLAYTFSKWYLQIYATCDFFANKFVCTFLTDLLTRFC